MKKLSFICQPICPDCRNGECISPGQCKCDAGYEGQHCNQSMLNTFIRHIYHSVVKQPIYFVKIRVVLHSIQGSTFYKEIRLLYPTVPPNDRYFFLLTWDFCLFQHARVKCGAIIVRIFANAEIMLNVILKQAYVVVLVVILVHCKYAVIFRKL